MRLLWCGPGNIHGFVLVGELIILSNIGADQIVKYFDLSQLAV